MYVFLKTVHVGCVLLTFVSFSLRGIWMLADSPMLQRIWVKVVPHAIDTVLLASAIGLTIEIHQYPGRQGWLTAKVIGLVAYIVLGTIALRRGRSKRVRVSAWLAALAVFFYIVAVALTHNAFPLAALG